jgi:hypothetical protein
VAAKGGSTIREKAGWICRVPGSTSGLPTILELAAIHVGCHATIEPMNLRLCALLTLICATTALAADPFAGTWKQNKQMGGGALYVPSDVPVIEKIDVAGDTVKIKSSETESEKTFSLDGAYLRITEGRNAGEDDSLKRLHPNVWAFQRKTHGKTYPGRNDPTAYDEEGYYTISVNEKIMIWAVLRTYSDGRTIYYNRVFERQ